MHDRDLTRMMLLDYYMYRHAQRGDAIGVVHAFQSFGSPPEAAGALRTALRLADRVRARNAGSR